MKVHPAAAVFPMLPDDELQALADDIAANGLRHPIVVDANGVLLDGRNRLAACAIAGVKPQKVFHASADPVGFIVSANLRRRHLTAGQRSMLALELLPHYEAQAAKRKGGRPRRDAKPSAPVHSVSKASEEAARATGASARNVAHAKQLAAEAPDLADQVRAGKLPIKRAERLLRDRKASAERAERAAAAEIPASIEIRAGDFRDVLADLTGVDAIICDPPYPAEYLDLLDDLAVIADKILAADGVLAVLMGQSHLPEVYRRLAGGRPYRWTGCYLTPGAGYVSHPRRVQSNWKPVLVYGGGRRFADVVRAENTDELAKQHHRWGQDYAGIATLVDRLTDPGHLVVDPFVGGGTTALACRDLGRRFIGCDIDPAAIGTTKERLAS